MMEMVAGNNATKDDPKLPLSEAIPQENSAISTNRTEGVSILTSENATSAGSETSAPQYFNLPILQEGCIDPQQSYILATSADGNTILVEASQLALLSDQSIPLYDGSNIFQLASQTVLDSSSLIFSKETDDVLEEPVNIIENNIIEKSRGFLQDHDEILPPDRKGPFKCGSCGMEVSSEKQLIRHYWKTHAEDKPNRCSQCDASFNKKSNLLLHEATHCKSDPTCPICHRKFQRLAGLKSHMLFHKTEESLVCSECGEEFNTQNKLDKHVQEHLAELTMDQTFFCRTCKKGFRKLAYLKEHKKIHHKLKTSLHRRHYKRNVDRSAFPHKCYFCGKQFQKPSQLIRHNRIHTGERPFKCDMCERAFNQKGALLIHKTKHTGARPYTCDFCPAAFAQKGNLRNHINRVHWLLTQDSTAGVHKCELCTCVFRKIGSLNAHMSKAHATTSLSFIEISKGENSQDVSNALNQIMEMSKTTRPDLNKENIKKIAVESNVSADILQQALENSGLASTEQTDPSRPYVMTVADSATGVLRRHIMRDVGGVKWYQCVYCTKEFKKPSDLVRHIRIHTHEKPYKCDQCYRAFAVKSTLSAHIRTHTGAKDYSCEHCKKLFSTSGSLKVHLLLHTGARPFSCTICGKAFRTSGHRNTHQASHSREKSVRRPRKSTKPSNVEEIVANIALQEPILITDEGLVQPVSKTITMHTELAQSDRPYRCDMCQKAFKKSSHLKQHIRSHTGEKPYNCPQCERSFVSNGVLKAHLRTHSGNKTFACHLCSAAFTTNGSLKRHMCIHSTDRPYMCPYCQKTFKTSMNCKKHMNTHRYELALGMGGVAVTVVQDGGQNHDGSVKEVLSSNGNVSNEIGGEVRILSGNNTHPIIALGESFNSDPGTNLADSEVFTQMPQQLSQEVYNTQTGMMEQVEIVTQSQENEQTSNNLFLSISDIAGSNLTLQHEATNEEFIPSNSEAEDAVENTLQHESADITIEEKTETVKTKGSKRRVKVLKKPFQCDQCSKVFKKSSHLKQHIFSHTGEKRFRCTTCGNMFSHARVLQQHIKAKHEHRKDFKCILCNSEFSARSSLIRHLAVHDENQPFHCAYCISKFSMKEQYRQHLKELHPNAFSEEADAFVEENGGGTTIQIPEETGETSINLANVDTVLLQSVTEKDQDTREFLPKHPHLCPQCSKSFKKPSDLVRHMRIHTGERPYKCDSCGKAFTVKSTLDSHQKTHTGEKNFSCHICMSLFATKGSLKVHMRLHTGSRPFKCHHCDLHFRTSGHRKSHVASHFKQSTGRKQKRSRLNETQIFSEVNDAHPNVETSFPVVSVAEEAGNVTLSTSGIQVPNSNQTTIQLQTSNLVNPNIQLVDNSLMTKTIQIDASVWQQLQQHLNFNITIDPSLTNPLNGKNGPDSNQTQILNVDGMSTSTLPGTFTINPNMIIHQLGFTINPQQQNEVQSSENVTLIIPENKTGNAVEEYQTSELFDSQVLTLETNGLGEAEMVVSHKNTGQELFVNNCNVATFAEVNSSAKEAASDPAFNCDVCDKVFKTAAQLKRHSKTHKEKPKDIYHCQACNKDFKKNNQFLKHLQTHK